MSSPDLNLLMIRGFDPSNSRHAANEDEQISQLHMKFRQDSRIPVDFSAEICRGLDFESTRRVLDNLRDLPPQTAAIIAAIYVEN